VTGAPTPAQLANQAAEAVRSLNHATFPGTSTLVFPSDAYGVIASLSVLASRLPQLLAQLDRWLTSEVEAGHVVVDAGEYACDPQAAAAVASHWLDQATTAAEALHRALDQAQQASAYLATSSADSGRDDAAD
jgi:hypothetical protein